MRTSIELMQAAYDQIAEDYDRRSAYLRAPQRRLTAALGLTKGLRCADLGCGTGLETLDMLQCVAPGEVVAVEPSAGMLEAAERRAHAAGLALTTCCRGAEEFVAEADAGSFDVITLRFCVGYLDWRATLPSLPRLLRPRGRIGLLTNLASSAHQAYATYQEMVRELGLPDVAITAPPSLALIEEQLKRGGAQIDTSWTHRFRLWFSSGSEMASWLRESGLATHPALQALPSALAEALWQRFAERIEARREQEGLPLDLAFAGVVASPSNGRVG